MTIDPKQAADLTRKAQADKRSAQQKLDDDALLQAMIAAKQEDKAERSVRDWDKAMSRAFKGIMGRNVRMMFLRAEKKRLERD